MVLPCLCYLVGHQPRYTGYFPYVVSLGDSLDISYDNWKELNQHYYITLGTNKRYERGA
jgi:hypothetical protein